MENRQTNDQLEARIKDMIMENVPESEIVDKKMEAAYNGIREMKTAGKRKVPSAVKFSAAAAVLVLAMVYCVKNPALAAQLPLIGNIFHGLEGKVSYPGDYSSKSIAFPAAEDDKVLDAARAEAGGDNEGAYQEEAEGNTAGASQAETAGSEGGASGAEAGSSAAGASGAEAGSSAAGASGAEAGSSGGKADKTQTQGSQGETYQAEAGGITVTLSEAAFDHDAFYLAILVQNEKGFVKDALYPDQLTYDAQVKMHKADGSTEKFSYKSEGRFTKSIEGEFEDSHTFKGIFQFTEPGLDLLEYTSCDVVFGEFQQQLAAGVEETVTVPDYGEVTQTIYDTVDYTGPWKFHLDLDGVTVSEEEVTVHEVNKKGFGIEKVVKTAFEIYAVPILPEGEKGYDYIAVVWDADGKPLETRKWGDYLSMSHYGRDVSEVTVYLLKAEDFFENKGNKAYGQPEKAIYQTTVSFEDQ